MTTITVPVVKTSATSRVPIEIWREVILLLTHLPGELSIAGWKEPYDILELGRLDFSYHYSGNGSQSGHPGHQGHMSHLCTMRSLRIQLEHRLKLALVSRMWYEIMTPILYRTVVIRCARELQMVHWLVSNSEAIASSIRRIHILINANGFARSRNALTTIAAAPLQTTGKYNFDLNEPVDSLLEICPRLSILRDSSARSSFFNWSLRKRAILQQCLQYLHGREAGIHFSSMEVRAFIREVSKFSALRVLVLPSLHLILDWANSTLYLPNLEVLDIGNQIDVTESMTSWIVGGGLPSLHTLHLCPASQPDLAFAGFWRVLGRQLRTLHIDLRSIRVTGPLNQILPNLRQLILYPIDTTDFGQLPPTSPTGSIDQFGSSEVEILEVNSMKNGIRISSEHIKKAMEIADTMPCLRILRFSQMLLSTPQSQLGQMKVDIATFKNILATKTVRIESNVYYRDLENGSLVDVSLIPGYFGEITIQTWPHA